MTTMGIEKRGPGKTVQGLKTDSGGDKRKSRLQRNDSKFSSLSGSEEDSVIYLNKKYRRKNGKKMIS